MLKFTWLDIVLGLSLLFPSPVWTAESDATSEPLEPFLQQTARGFLVSTEDAYIKMSGETIGIPLELHGLIQTEKDKESLQETLEKEMPGGYRVEAYPAGYLIRATGDVDNESIKYINNMDVLISLRIKDGTVWEALKAINIALNDSNQCSVPNEISLYFRTAFEPSLLTVHKAVTIDVQSISAREVLEEVIKQSPLPLSYEYDIGLVNTYLGARTIVSRIIIHIRNKEGMPVECVLDGKLMPWTDDIRLWRSGETRGTPAASARWEMETREANSRYNQAIKEPRN